MGAIQQGSIATAPACPVAAKSSGWPAGEGVTRMRIDWLSFGARMKGTMGKMRIHYRGSALRDLLGAEPRRSKGVPRTTAIGARSPSPLQ